MYAAEGIEPVSFGALHFSGSDVGPSYEAHIVVETEIALCLALGDEECGIALMGGVEVGKIDIAEDVAVVYEHWGGRDVRKEFPCMLYAATGIKEVIALIRDEYLDRGEFHL